MNENNMTREINICLLLNRNLKLNDAEVVSTKNQHQSLDKTTNCYYTIFLHFNVNYVTIPVNNLSPLT